MTANTKWPQQKAEGNGTPDTERSLFTWSDPKAIAAVLKQTAEANRRRKSGPFQSAMSVLTVHINRAGDDLDVLQRQVLEAVKDELREAFGRPRRD